MADEKAFEPTEKGTPLRWIDNGDGTFSELLAGGGGGGPLPDRIAYRPEEIGAMQKFVDNGDGSWSRQVVVDGAGGGGTYEASSTVPNGARVAFTFTAPPVMVFRNGVMETRLGSIAGNVFTFDSAPETGDDVEGLV